VYGVVVVCALKLDMFYFLCPSDSACGSLTTPKREARPQHPLCRIMGIWRLPGVCRHHSADESMSSVRMGRC
jgi:hypothetical protein